MLLEACLMLAALTLAALKFDGSVVVWGDAAYGASIDKVRFHIASDVQRVFSSQRAFAALKNDGTVVTWGHFKDRLWQQDAVKVNLVLGAYSHLVWHAGPMWHAGMPHRSQHATLVA